MSEPALRISDLTKDLVACELWIVFLSGSHRVSLLGS